MIYRAYKYRLWPTEAQAESLNRCFAAVRQVYNAALEQRRTYGRRKGSGAFGRDSRFNAPRQAREINFRSLAGRPGLLDDPELRWITETPRDCLDAALTGSRIVAVDPKNTSRTCPVCGHVAAENRQSQSAFLCIACGHADHADINAARTILARALASAGATARRKTPSESGCGSATSNGHVSCFQPASTLDISSSLDVCPRAGADAEPGDGCGFLIRQQLTYKDAAAADMRLNVAETLDRAQDQGMRPPLNRLRGS